MRRTAAYVLLLTASLSCAWEVSAETIDVRLRIGRRRTEEQIITRENLIKTQQFILKRGKRETYCSMYSNNPAYGTKSYRFYLNPDTGQENINCDPEKSGFHHLTIRRVDGGPNQYRTVEFLDKHYVYITANRPTDDLTVQQVRQFVVDAMEEIMTEIRKKANKPDAGDGG